MKIEDFFRDVPNFPKEGILFKDITPLLLNYEATKLCLDTLASTLINRKINKVIGVESRGFFLWNAFGSKIKCQICSCS